MERDAAEGEEIPGSWNQCLLLGLIASTMAVGSTYVAAGASHLRDVHVPALVLGAFLAIAAGVSLVIPKAGRIPGKPAARILAVLAVMLGLGICWLVVLDGLRHDQIVRFVDGLEERGFYRDAPPGTAVRSRQFRTVEEVVLDAATGRAFPLDPDELTQGGATRFLVRVSPFLERQGIRLRMLNNSFEIGGAYVLRIDGVEQELYSREEAGSPHLDVLCVSRVVGIINALLERQHAEERLRICHRGATQAAVFFTDSQWSMLGPEWSH